MKHRSFATIISPCVIGLASLAGSPSLHAQARYAASSPLDLPPTALLAVLSQYRAVRWTTSSRAVFCAPAPLTERPGIQTEYSRPRVVPLEESFADAQSVKRSMAYRARPVAMDNR